MVLDERAKRKEWDISLEDEIELKDWVYKIVIPTKIKTEVENFIPENLLNKIIYIEKNCKDIWEWTEKVDGTNIRLIWDGHNVSFAGRTDKAQIPDHLLEKLEQLFGGINKEVIFEQNFGEKEVTDYEKKHTFRKLS